jgi:catechol 2,3-dioxygenase-like lactoylglutathione lyase family enzyme
MIGRLHHVIVDCPDPGALAAFYGELLGLPVTWREDDFVVISRDDRSSGIGGLDESRAQATSQA